MLIAAKSHRKLDAELSARNLPSGKDYPIVDASGKAWVLITKHMVVSPLILKHRWTKKEIVRMFNDSTNARLSNMRYPERSLGNKRLDRIVAEIVEVILTADKRMRTTTRGGSAKSEPQGG